MKSSAFVSLIDRYIAEGSFAGAALIAAQGGKIVIEHYAGNAAPGLAASPTVLWPVASITKVYTAAMIMRLVEEGRLTLNRLVHEVLHQFTGDERATIRLRHLLAHTAGMSYESPTMEARLIAQTPRVDLIEEMYRAPLRFAPGTAFGYADYHYLLAGCMAEAVTGQSFADLVDEWILQPMGLDDTYIRPPQAVYERLAKVRSAMGEGTAGAMYNAPYALSLAHPAFSAVATARDLLHFAQHFAPGGPRIHSAATIRTMTTDQTGGWARPHDRQMGLHAETYVPWGIGFALKSVQNPNLFAELASVRAYGHGGASGCQLVIDPEADAVIALITNTHARAGRELWHMRLQSILNSAFASLR